MKSYINPHHFSLKRKIGYKLLIETPAPQEGNWEPEWFETEDQITCNWIETEPLLENITEIET